MQVRAFERYIPLKESKKHICLFLFTFLNWEKQTWYWEKMWLLSFRNRAEMRPLEKGRKDPDHSANDSRNFWAQWK